MLSNREQLPMDVHTLETQSLRTTQTHKYYEVGFFPDAQEQKKPQNP